LGDGSGRVLAVDPGGTIGLAWAPLDGPARLKGGEDWDHVRSEWGWDQLDTRLGGRLWRSDGKGGWGDEDQDGVWAVLMRMRELDVRVLVYERFLPRPNMTYKLKSWSAIRQLAMLDFALNQKWWGGEIIRQVPSDMGVMTTERMKASGLWVVGKPHAVAARKHLVVYFRRHSGLG
jgi:hypothetical protein